MSKIICDICGTSYPETSDCCPICGCSRDAAAEFLGADAHGEQVPEEPKVKPGRFAVGNKKKEIFDYDEVNAEEEPDEDEEEYEEEDYDTEEEEEEAPRHNTFVVIILTILIVVLLAAAGFILFKYFLPNRGGDTAPETTAAVQTEVTTAPTEATVPCEHMLMTNSGIANLNAEGQQFLLHIKTIPEDTTDKIVYTSGDEGIATVTEDGKITAVSEGETVIYISCGEQFIECPVIVQYIEETVPPTTETVVAETVPETTAATEAATLSDVTLKLKKTDIRLGVYYEFQLELDCELKPEEVTWTSEHPHIAKVDEKGNVTALKEGTTSITAQYGSQKAECIVRCGWY